MAKRGRVSVAALSVVSPADVEAVQRPDAPYDLTDEQSEEWWAVVNRMPADWFPRETHGMLAQYCRHVVAARRVAEMIRVLEAEIDKSAAAGEDKAQTILAATKSMDRLFKMQEREGRAISSLATRMRISQQATVRAEQARKPSQVKKPWET